MFQLTPADFARGVLDCGGGPASFAAESVAAGYRVVAVDPIYACAGNEIRARFEAIAQPMLAQVQATPDHWTWGYHRNPDHLLANRRAALDTFLSDYESAADNGRYVVGQLPALPFATGAFGLALCSHLLFLYSHLLTAAFHIASVAELSRIAGEVRIFPLITLLGEPSPHLDPVRRAVEAAGGSSELVLVPYELQRGGNQMLRIL
jgi:hypothetical protein